MSINALTTPLVIITCQKHIKFNGVTYQVQVQRMKDGKMVTEKPFYTKSLTEAKKIRDQRVAKSPPKSFKDFNFRNLAGEEETELLLFHLQVFCLYF